MGLEYLRLRVFGFRVFRCRVSGIYCLGYIGFRGGDLACLGFRVSGWYMRVRYTRVSQNRGTASKPFSLRLKHVKTMSP